MLVNLGKARDSPAWGCDKHGHAGHKLSPAGSERVLEDLGEQNFRLGWPCFSDELPLTTHHEWCPGKGPGPRDQSGGLKANPLQTFTEGCALSLSFLP